LTTGRYATRLNAFAAEVTRVALDFARSWQREALEIVVSMRAHADEPGNWQPCGEQPASREESICRDAHTVGAMPWQPARLRNTCREHGSLRIGGKHAVDRHTLR